MLSICHSQCGPDTTGRPWKRCVDFLSWWARHTFCMHLAHICKLGGQKACLMVYASRCKALMKSAASAASRASGPEAALQADLIASFSTRIKDAGTAVRHSRRTFSYPQPPKPVETRFFSCRRSCRATGCPTDRPGSPEKPKPTSGAARARQTDGRASKTLNLQTSFFQNPAKIDRKLGCQTSLALELPQPVWP